MRKLLLLAFFACAPFVGNAASDDVEIRSWGDIEEHIVGRGESIIKQISLVAGQGIDLPSNINNAFNIRTYIENVGGDNNLFKVTLVSTYGRSVNGVDEEGFDQYYLSDANGENGDVVFSSLNSGYLDNAGPALTFYIYLPYSQLFDTENYPKILYQASSGSETGEVLPGCFSFDLGVDVPSSNYALPKTDTCDNLKEGYARYTLDDSVNEFGGIKGSGWLYAEFPSEVSKFEGLILVIQDKEEWLELPGLTADNDNTITNPVDSAQNSGDAGLNTANESGQSAGVDYYSLIAVPVNAMGGEAIRDVTVSDKSDEDFVPRELVASTQAGNKNSGTFTLVHRDVDNGSELYFLSTPNLKQGEGAHTDGVDLDIALLTRIQECTGRLVFFPDLSNLEGPAQLACNDDGDFETAAQSEADVATIVDAVRSSYTGDEPGPKTIRLSSTLANVTTAISILDDIQYPLEKGICGAEENSDLFPDAPAFCASKNLVFGKTRFNVELEIETTDGTGTTVKFVSETEREDIGAIPQEILYKPDWKMVTPEGFGVEIVFELDGIDPEEFGADFTFRIKNDDGQFDHAEVLAKINADGTVTVKSTIPDLHLSEGILEYMLGPEERARTQKTDAVYVTIGSKESANYSYTISPANLDVARTSIPTALQFSIPLSAILGATDSIIRIEIKASPQQIDLSGRVVPVAAASPDGRGATYCRVGVVYNGDEHWLDVVSGTQRSSFKFPEHMPSMPANTQLQMITEPVDFTVDITRELSNKLCEPDSIGVVSVADVDAGKAILVPLGRPILTYFLRSRASDSKYGSNKETVYRIWYTSVRKLAETRLSQIYMAIRRSGQGRGYRAVEYISARLPYSEVVTEDMIDRGLANLIGKGVQDSNRTIENVLKDVVKAREGLGLSGGNWPDVTIFTSGLNQLTCRDIERAVNSAGDFSAPDAVLTIFYDSYTALKDDLGDPLSGYASSFSCDKAVSGDEIRVYGFGQINILITNFSAVFREGRDREDDDILDLIQNEWQTMLDTLAGEYHN